MKGKAWRYSCVFVLWSAAETEISLLQQQYLLPGRSWFCCLGGKEMKNTSPQSCYRLEGQMTYILLAWNLAKEFVYREWKFPVIKTKFRWFFPESPKAVHTRFEESFQHQMTLIKEDFLSTGCEGGCDSTQDNPTTGLFWGRPPNSSVSEKGPVIPFLKSFFQVINSVFIVGCFTGYSLGPWLILCSFLQELPFYLSYNNSFDFI